MTETAPTRWLRPCGREKSSRLSKATPSGPASFEFRLFEFRACLIFDACYLLFAPGGALAMGWPGKPYRGLSGRFVSAMSSLNCDAAGLAGGSSRSLLETHGVRSGAAERESLQVRRHDDEAATNRGVHFGRGPIAMHSSSERIAASL